MSVNSNVPNERGCISTNLARKFSRVATENKNLLQFAGSMYIGTGAKNNVGVSTSVDDSVSENIAITESIGDSNGCFKNSGLDQATSATPLTPGSGQTNTYTLKMSVDDQGNIKVYWVKD